MAFPPNPALRLLHGLEAEATSAILEPVYEYGHIPHLRIATLVELCPALFERQKYILVSSIDSDRAFSPTKLRHLGMSSLVSYALVVTGTEFYRWATSSPITLVGFDEVWAFSALPAAGVPSQVSLIGESGELAQRVNELDDWIVHSSPAFGFGDGLGLSYVFMHRTDEWQFLNVVLDKSV